MLAWTKIQCKRQCGQSKSGHKIMQQANIINMITNKYELQQKHRLGTVSKNYLGGLNRFYEIPTSPSAPVMAQNI